MLTVDWSRLTIVSVTHHSAAVIGKSMAAIRSAANIIIVDNASDDDTLDIVRRTVPQARIIKNIIGTGYGTAANLGMEAADTEFILTLNPDAFISDAVVAHLLAAADRYPDAGMLSPAHRSESGTLTFTHDVDMFQAQLSSTPLSKWGNETAPEGDLCADFVSGAVNLFRKTAIEKIGGFDPKIFLYYDDDDICIRLRKAEYSIIQVPDAEICHIDGGSVRPSTGYIWEKYWHYGWSRLYIERKYRGLFSACTLGLRHVFLFGLKCLFRALLPTAKNRTKAFRDLAKFVGTIAFLLGLRAIDPDVFAKNSRAREQSST